MKAFIVGIIVVVILGVGSFFVFHKSSSKPATVTNSQVPNNGSTSTQNAPNTITFTNNGFTPASLTVKAGTTVTIKNTSSEEMQFDSDPHPMHTDDTDLNVGLVQPGQSQTFVVTKMGNFGYHNHLNPSETGRIIID